MKTRLYHIIVTPNEFYEVACNNAQSAVDIFISNFPTKSFERVQSKGWVDTFNISVYNKERFSKMLRKKY